MERIICTLLPFPLSTISAPSPMISDWASRLSGIKGSHAIASRIMCTTNATSAAIRPDCAGRHTREPVLRTKPEQTVQSCVDKSRLIWQWTISCFCQKLFLQNSYQSFCEKTLISSFQKKPPCAATVSYTSIKSRSGHLQLWFEPATHPTISPQSPHSFLYYLIFSIVIFCPFSAVDLSCWLHIFSLLLLPSWFCTGYTYTDG